jgi:hypothetical protein
MNESKPSNASIYERMRSDLILKERGLWTALTSADAGHAITKMCRPDATLIFPNKEILCLDKVIAGKQGAWLDNSNFSDHRFDDFTLEDLRVVAVDLMAAVVTYKVVGTRGSSKYTALAATTWAQDSDFDYHLVAHQETLV